MKIRLIEEIIHLSNSAITTIRGAETNYNAAIPGANNIKNVRADIVAKRAIERL